MEVIFLAFVGLIVAGAILYSIIWRAVRHGINRSLIGTFFEEKHGMKEIEGDEDLFDQ
ncbi:hypothetical protein [Rossellomorea sp. YZS02]|uniref:hypothetical protein n=1 Tax=Rossellomorea sp. YZS02 TaxID=3097358 RepID=UPI002A0B4BA2|nr:hypothetical protein [Rossellomorea sp. YZS02]MDX8344508.1 hypothetical protein [Rossellomorea sp. YZS02]